MLTLVSAAMILMGAAIAAVWTKDILFNEQIDLSKGFFKSRDPDGGTLFWPHWLAEYTTAGCLLAGGIGSLLEAKWAPTFSLFALGALFYTSCNSLGWAFAKPERLPYAVPMVVGVLVSLLCLVAIFRT